MLIYLFFHAMLYFVLVRKQSQHNVLSLTCKLKQFVCNNAAKTAKTKIADHAWNIYL